MGPPTYHSITGRCTMELHLAPPTVEDKGSGTGKCDILNYIIILKYLFCHLDC